MKRAILGAIVVLRLAVFASQGWASPAAGHWVVTDVAAQARLEFPGYTDVALVGMTPGGRVIWTAQRPGQSQWDREVFQWQSGKIVDLGPLPRHSLPQGFNAGGAIVGSSQDPPYCPSFGPGAPDCHPGPGHAYLWQPGKTTLLPTLGGPSSGAAAINDRGQIVGVSQTPNEQTHGVLWQNGTLTDLGAGYPWAINDRGQVLEDVTVKKGYETVLWQGGKATPIKLPSRDFEVRALNDRGQVLGDFTKTNAYPHAFVWHDGKVTDLGPTFGGYPMAINDRGDVVVPQQGWENASRGVLWRNGKKIVLGSLGGPETFPAALNERDEVVGISTLRGSTFENPDTHAFFWQNGKMTMLPSDGAVLYYEAPMAIDPAGTLVAGGTGPFECDQNGCDGELLVWQYRR